MTESWHWFVKYKIRNTQNKYTCIEIDAFFPLGGDWKENRFWAISPVSGREPRDFCSWNDVKVSDICPCLNLDTTQILGGSSSASATCSVWTAYRQISDRRWAMGGQRESRSCISVSPSMRWARASFLPSFLEHPQWSELPRVCHASRAGCKGGCAGKAEPGCAFTIFTVFQSGALQGIPEGEQSLAKLKESTSRRGLG